MSDDVTLGELYRLCQRIEAHAIKTNGRVDELETRTEATEKDIVRIKAYWSAGAVAVAVLGDWAKRKVGL